MDKLYYGRVADLVLNFQAFASACDDTGGAQFLEML
jgi:hypothetical protein